MQLKLKRSQRMGGVVSKSVVFCIDARAEFAADERANLTRYKLYDQVIYNSEAQMRLLEKSAAQQDGSVSGSFKSLATSLLARTKLYVTVASLERGQHIECKSLDELLAAEEALMQACQNLRAYLQTAQSFDGREVLIDFSTEQPEVVARAASAEPMLAVPSREVPKLPPRVPPPAPSVDAGDAGSTRNSSEKDTATGQLVTMIDRGLDTPGKQAFVIGVLIALAVVFIWSLMA